jgi:hypothetical protein
MSFLSVPKNRKIASGVMGMLMLFIVLFSAFYIAAEAGHDCRGEDCPVCACILQCEKTLHQTGEGAAPGTAVFILAAFLFFSILLVTADFPKETPVSRKIRLNI